MVNIANIDELMRLLEKIPEKQRIPRIDSFLLQTLNSGYGIGDAYMLPNSHTYAMDRIRPIENEEIWSDDKIKSVIKGIALHNGLTKSELIPLMPTSSFEEIDLDKTKESALIDSAGVLHIAHPNSKLRQRRFEDMIYTGCVLSEDSWTPSFNSLLLKDSHTTKTRYKNRAYDWVKEVSLENKKLEDIDYVTIGRLDWVRKFSENKVKILKDVENEYLDYAVAEIDGKKMLCIDYVFSDQMGKIVEYILDTYAEFSPEDKVRDIHILMYGKVGGIRPPQERDELVFPNGVISDKDVEHGNINLTKLQNVLYKGSDDENHYVLFSNSVPLQKKSILRKGQERGCSIVEMEAFPATQQINLARIECDNLRIHQGFVGFVFDRPFEGEPIITNREDSIGKNGCVKTVSDYIDYHS